LDTTKNDDYKSACLAFMAAAALLCASLWLPEQYAQWLVPLSVLINPLVLGYAVAKSGFVLGGAAAVLCYAAGCMLDVRLSGLMAAMCLPLAFAIGFALRKKKRFRHSVMITSGAALAGVVLSVGVLWLLTGEKPVDFFISRLELSLAALDEATIRSAYQFIRTADLSTGAVTQTALDATSSADAIAYLLNQYREILNVSLVSMIGVYALLMGLLGYLIPRASLKKRKGDVIAIPAFSDYALPNRFWLAYVLSYLFALIGDSLGWQGFDILQNTVSTLYALVLTVQGLSLLDYLYKRRKMGTSARVVLHVLALVIGSVVTLIGTLLVWAGLFENIAKVRKRIETKGGTVI
jgi:uncharacterized protein YybS (DUF2232 family)